MKTRSIHFLIILYTGISIIACKEKKEYSKTSLNKNTTTTLIDWSNTHNYYLENISRAITFLDSLNNEGFNHKRTQLIFAKVRESFKKSEPFISLLNPQVGHQANGPALPIYKEDSGKVITPIGLQKLEETIYEEGGNEDDFKREIYILKGIFGNLKKNSLKHKLNPQRFFVATHQQLMRLVSLSMSGFDTPISGLSIRETAISLESLFNVYKLSIQPLVQLKNKTLDHNFHQNINNAIAFIDNDPNFETFDRFTFIRDHLNPITRNWVKIRKTTALWETNSRAFPFNFNAPTFFENDSFNTNFFLDVNDQNPTKERIELGEKLFFDKNLSKNGTMSCATCHIASKGYTDGLALGKDNEGNLLQRNTPTLLNSIYQKSFFWDGKANSINNQISMVFKNKKEFNTEVHQFSGNILKDTTYIDLFKKAYGSIPKKNKETIRAISAYLTTLKSFNSKFDKNIRGEENTFTTSEKNGFNLFMGKALCATCHFIPLTNGTVPPFFNETEKEVIGVPETANNKQLDNDLGFYWVFKEELHRGMFKTTSLRNASLTAPYMHNGIYNTLEEVMDFYNKGGGAGLGFDLPYQTLPFDNLNLSKQELNDLIAFIKSLTNNIAY